MNIELHQLESTLKEIKSDGEPIIHINPQFDEDIHSLKVNPKATNTNIYADIKINSNSEKKRNESDFEFLSFDSPPDLFIESGLLTKDKSLEKISNPVFDLVKPSIKDKFNLCEINKCLELPIIFKKVFTDYDLFYRYGVIKEFNFLHSLMCTIDPMYGSYTLQNRKSEIDCLFNKLLFEFPKMYEKYNYRKFGYKKGILQSKLSNNKKIDRSVQRYVSNYFNINILVVKMRYQKYYICGDYDPRILSIIMINYEDIFEPILNQNGNHYFKDAQSLLEKEFTLEPSEEKKIMEISADSEEEKQLKIKLFKKKKASEIYELCEKLDIKLEVGLGKKKKKKDDLIIEIIGCMD